MVSGLHRALFSSFLGDLVREHIGLKILSWKKVDKESRDKLWDEITIKNKEIEADEEPPRDKDVDPECQDQRGGSGVTDKRYFPFARSRQATDERIELLQTQLDNERRECQQKDVLVNKLSNEMTETKGMLSQLVNQLAAQGGQLNLSSQLHVASDVSHFLCLGRLTPIGAYEVDRTQSSVVVRDKNARIKKKSNGLVTSEKEPVKIVRLRKNAKSRRKGVSSSPFEGNVFQHKKLTKLAHLSANCGT
ncbi:hypothetical protein Tco_0740904 [Tanacetum coccineum]